MFQTAYLDTTLVAAALARKKIQAKTRGNPACLKEIIKKKKWDAREFLGLNKYRNTREFMEASFTCLGLERHDD